MTINLKIPSPVSQTTNHLPAPTYVVSPESDILTMIIFMRLIELYREESKK